jgi:hypothetical protein
MLMPEARPVVEVMAMVPTCLIYREIRSKT